MRRLYSFFIDIHPVTLYNMTGQSHHLKERYAHKNLPSSPRRETLAN